MTSLYFAFLLPAFSLGHAAGTGWGRGSAEDSGPFGGAGGGGFWAELGMATWRPFCMNLSCPEDRRIWRLLPFAALFGHGCCRDPWRSLMEGGVLLAVLGLMLSPAAASWGVLPLAFAFWIFGLLSAADRVSGEAPGFALFGLFWAGLALNPLLPLGASVWGALALWALFGALTWASQRRPGPGFQGFGEGDWLCATALGAWLGPFMAAWVALAAGGVAGAFRVRDCPFLALLCGLAAPCFALLPWLAEWL